MRSLLLLIVWIFSSLLFAKQNHNDTIYIHTENLADLYALNDKNMQHNLSVSTNLYVLKKQLANIRFDYMPGKRSLLQMSNNKNICVVNRIKTKARAGKYLFSKPVNIFLSRRLYQNVSYPALKPKNSFNHNVLLSELFSERPNAKVIITAQISYGDKLDAQIAAIPQDNKVIRHGGEHEVGVMSMFAKGRAEFALLYPHQVYESDIEISGRSYTLASIPPYVLGHFMCTNNEVTKEFITSINKYLNSPDNINELLEIHLNYINPIDQHAIEQFFSQAFVN